MERTIRIYRSANGNARARCVGEESRTRGVVMFASTQTLAIQWPGNHYFIRRGERGYEPALIEIFQIIDADPTEGDERTFRVRTIVGFPARGHEVFDRIAALALTEPAVSA